MKAIRKDKVIDHNAIESISLERKILYESNHPFLVDMKYGFQTDERLFFIMSFIRGGELWTHLRNVRRFKED